MLENEIIEDFKNKILKQYKVKDMTFDHWLEFIHNKSILFDEFCNNAYYKQNNNLAAIDAQYTDPTAMTNMLHEQSSDKTDIRDTLNIHTDETVIYDQYIHTTDTLDKLHKKHNVNKESIEVGNKQSRDKPNLSHPFYPSNINDTDLHKHNDDMSKLCSHKNEKQNKDYNTGYGKDRSTINYAYQETVRGIKRNSLHGEKCKCCEKYFAGHESSVQKSSRHRSRNKKIKTPPGFYDLDF